MPKEAPFSVYLGFPQHQDNVELEGASTIKQFNLQIFLMKKPRLSEMPLWRRWLQGTRVSFLASLVLSFPDRSALSLFFPPPQAFQTHFLLHVAHDLFPKHSAAAIWKTNNTGAVRFCGYLGAHRQAVFDLHE